MKIRDILKLRDQGVSFEFFPPASEKSKTKLIETVKALEEYNPLYVSMTCGAGGAWQDQTKTKEAVDILLREQDLVVMPHLTCIETKKSTIEGLLRDYQKKGIQNIMALRGDRPKQSDNSASKSKDFHYALDLVKLIREESEFCIGAAVYPEGHIESKSFQEDLDHSKEKIDAGADFAVTQMFFDNTYYYSFLERAEKAGITIPILPGILPLTNIAKVKEFASICRTTIPQDIEEKMEQAKGRPEEMERIGIEFTIRQCRDLKKQGFKRLHFFTLNRPGVMKAILDAI